MTRHLTFPSPRLTVATVVAASLLLAGCGSGTDDDPSGGPTATATPTPTPTEGAGNPETVATFTASNLALDGEGTATALEPADVRTWLTPRASDELVAQVEGAVEQVDGEGEQAYGVVLAVGCDAPEGWELTRVGGQVTVTVEKSRTQSQCLVPTTWLAVAAVDRAE